MFKKLCLVFLLLSGSAFASDQPIRIILPYSPGGAGDVLARLIQKNVTKRTIILEHKLGAGGEIATEYVANYRGNESVFLQAGTGLASYNTNKNPSYDIDNLKPVAFLGHIPMVLVSSKKFRYKSLKDWKNIPASEPIFYGSGGTNLSSHLAGEMLKQRTGKNLIHVPYKGMNPVIPDLMTDTVNLAFVSWTLALPHINAGNLVPLAVVSEQRLPALPNTPTFNELGYKNFGVKTWVMIVAGPSAKIEDIAIMQTALMQILNSTELSESLRTSVGLEYNINEIDRGEQILSKEISMYQKIYKDNPELAPTKK